MQCTCWPEVIDDGTKPRAPDFCGGIGLMGQRLGGRFYRVVREHLVAVKGRLSIAAVCTLLLAFADLLRPWPLKLIFDYVLFKKPIPHSLSFMHDLVSRGPVVAVIIISSGIVVIALLKSFAAYSQTHIVSQI